MAINDDMTDETREGLEMAGLPIVQFEPPAKQLTRTKKGELKTVTTPGWIKFGIAFRNELCKMDDSSLNVFMCICLHVNSEREAWPSLDTICLETNRSRATVTKAIKHLKRLGLLDVTRDPKHRSNTYRPLYAAYGNSSDIELPTVQNLNSNSSDIKPEVEPRSRTKEDAAIAVSLNDWFGKPPTPPENPKTKALTTGTEEHRKIIPALETLTGRKIDPKNKTTAAQIAELREWGATPAACAHFSHYWQVVEKWRGEHAKPSLKDVWERWGTAQNWQPNLEIASPIKYV